MIDDPMIIFPAPAITKYLNSIMLAIYNQGLLYKVCAFMIILLGN